jgi:hypothetical protein
MTVPLPRLRAADLIPAGTVGLRTRRARAALSVLGIAIGIAALVSVLGITRSSQADLLARIDRLGTNLLTVVNGHTIGGDEAQLPAIAGATVARTGGRGRRRVHPPNSAPCRCTGPTGSRCTAAADSTPARPTRTCCPLWTDT